jgi:hypothetical protein
MIQNPEDILLIFSDPPDETECPVSTQRTFCRRNAEKGYYTAASAEKNIGYYFHNAGFFLKVYLYMLR